MEDLSSHEADSLTTNPVLGSKFSIELEKAAPTSVGSSLVVESDYFVTQSIHIQRTGLKKDLGALNLIGLGVGCTIGRYILFVRICIMGRVGAGIFVLTGVCARDKTGPALFLSFIVSGFVSLLSAFSYAGF
jgi:hypothetical protein